MSAPRPDRRALARTGLGAVAVLAVGSAAAADAKPHRVALQASSEDRHTQALVIGNAHNYAAYYKAKGEPYAIEIVVFGPGYAMVRSDMSMMKGELETLQKDLGDSLVVSACQNTRRAIAESMGKAPADIPLLPGVKETPSGVVRLAELQEQGWAYIRP